MMDRATKADDNIYGSPSFDASDAMGTPALMEQMAIYFAALPCPPLPVLAARGDDGHLEPCNSHDLLASFMLRAMMLDSKELNERRKMFQIDSTKRLLTAFMANPEPGPERVYYLCQQFTADYISAFSTQPQGVHFAPIDDIPIKHKLHTACCGWNAGQVSTVYTFLLCYSSVAMGDMGVHRTYSTARPTHDARQPTSAGCLTAN